MYFDDVTGKEIDNPDANGGLWVVDRSSRPVKVPLPFDHLGCARLCVNVCCAECCACGYCFFFVLCGVLCVWVLLLLCAVRSVERVGTASSLWSTDLTPTALLQCAVWRVPADHDRWTACGHAT
jgi:hypothetical protein